MKHGNHLTCAKDNRAFSKGKESAFKHHEDQDHSLKCKLCELSFLPADRLFFEKHMEAHSGVKTPDEKDDRLVDEFEVEEREPSARLKIKEGAQAERIPTVQAAEVSRDLFTHSKTIWKEPVAGSPKQTQ